MKQDYNEMLYKISDIISKFLSFHGGLSNGYDTYIEGTVKYDYKMKPIKFHTPDTDSITGSMLKSLSMELNDEIISVLEAYDFKECIYIESIHRMHGIFDIVIGFKTSIEVKFKN